MQILPNHDKESSIPLTSLSTLILSPFAARGSLRKGTASRILSKQTVKVASCQEVIDIFHSILKNNACHPDKVTYLRILRYALISITSARGDYSAPLFLDIKRRDYLAAIIHRFANMASVDKEYFNIRRGLDDPEKYVKGKSHPVYLGDVLKGRYIVFRKLGARSQATVWLARDKEYFKNPTISCFLSTFSPFPNCKSIPKRTYVAIKVFSADPSAPEIRLNKLLKAVDHPGNKNVEISLDSFIIDGPNGQHFCKVLEPLGHTLKQVLETAVHARAKLNERKIWLGRALEGDAWSGKFAKKACRQILLGLDYLHSQQVAHRDIYPANICLALDYDISRINENELQKTVREEESVMEENHEEKSKERSRDERVKEDEEEGKKNTSEKEELNSWIRHEENKDDTETEGGVALEAKYFEDNDDWDDSSDDETTASDIAYQEELRLAAIEEKRIIDELWRSFDPGNILADPLSPEWQKANVIRSRKYIDLIRRKDGRLLQPTEIQYMVSSHQLDYLGSATLTDSSRAVLIDLGFACPIDECGQNSIETLTDFRPPESLIKDFSVTHKADIFSLGLLFWETVMLRKLVEAVLYWPQDLVKTHNRLLRDLVHRLGPLPPAFRAQWAAAAEFTDDAGNALDMQEVDDEEYDSECFEWGDIWFQARLRKPLDMLERDLHIFMDLVQSMLRFEPELRPSTSELLQHEWFKDM